MALKDSYSLIGMMSGTSLDGMDLCFAHYFIEKNKWCFKILSSKTYPYSSEMKKRIENAIHASALEITVLDRDLGNEIGTTIQTFIAEFSIPKNSIDAIASHGQTIFHQPEENITLQIGCGTSIALITNIKTINNFRLKDIRLKGQGAPLVPIGDQLLFDSQHTAFLNIGGFANISYNKEGKQYGFDICPANFVLNALCETIGQSYDSEGEIAKTHKIDEKLLQELNNLERYIQLETSSLGSEWVEKWINNLLEKNEGSTQSKIATYTEHIAQQITNYCTLNNINKLMITGGGTHNTHLINRIESLFKGQIDIPSVTIIDFKEALIFGFLGARYLRNEVNSLKEITGAERDSVGGILHLPY